MRRMLFFVFGALAAILVSARGDAAGFEKSVMWSGKYAGIGGNAVSAVTGSQSLYFNPAGLASGGDVSLNYSPTWINTEGSMVTLSRVDQSKSGVLPFGGGFASYGWGKFGFGMGFYVAGGEKAIYPNLDLTADSGKPYTTYTPTLETDLVITEYSLGAACELLPGLRFGAAWRISKAQGTLSSISKTVANTAYSHLVIRDAKDTNYNGFRLGAMYEDQVTHKWGIGAAYRSRVKFDAPGTGTGNTVVIPAPVNSVTAQSVLDTRIGLTFPEAYSLGGNFAVMETVKLYAGADFVKYSIDDKIYLVGTAQSATLPNIPLNWSDMWNWRLGAEYTGIPSLALRAGYVRTSQVTSSTDAKATLPPPGAGNLFTIGAGYSVWRNLDLDGAVEYGHNEGSGSMSMPTSGFKELLAGVNTTSTANTYALHTGVTYRF